MRFIESQKDVVHTLLYPSQHSATDRKRSYMFVLVYVLSFIAFGGNLLHFVSGWIAATVLQVVMIILILIYAFNINDYSDKSMSSMECERACNPLLDAYIALRGVQMIQAMLLRSWTCTLCFGSILAVSLWRVRSGKLYVDAVNLWREVAQYEKQGFIFIATDVVMLVVLMVVMVFSIVMKYSD